MINEVIFLSEEQACGFSGRFNAGVISITSKYNANLKGSWGAVLRLKFDDIDVEMTSHEAMCYRLFEEKDAYEILDWLKENENDLNVVVVHCAAGISRSAAIAKFIAEQYKIKNFNHQYTLYNKHVYRVLYKTYHGKLL